MKRRNFTRSFGRTYDGPRLRNPFFAARTPMKALRYLALAAVVTGGIGIPLVLVYAPFMRYNAVHVIGLTTLAPDDVTTIVNDALQRRRMLVVPGRNIFFAHLDGVAERLNAQFHFDALALRREGRMLIIEARERITEIAWTVADHTYLVDLTGIAAQEATPEVVAMITARKLHAVDVPTAPGVQPTMPLIDLVAEDDVVLGSTVIDPDRLRHILALDAGLRTRGMFPQYYTLQAYNEPWITVAVADGPSMLFDITTAPDGALGMYDAFAHDRDGDLSALLYVDLRFGNHVYSKNK